MSALVGFLRARLDEDATAWAHDVARSTDIAARRAIVDLPECCACQVEHQPCDHRDATLRLLAQPYAANPDYDPAWTPDA